MNNPRKRHCHVCGKPLTCDCYYADYGLVKLDGCGHTLTSSSTPARTA